MRSILFALALLAGTSPSVGQSLERIDTAEAIRGLEGVGRLDILTRDGDAAFCTATLVSPTRVLTAAHCVHASDGSAYLADEMTFRAGLRDGHADATRRVRRMVIHPAYRPGPRPTAETVAVDLALLELDRALDVAGVSPFAVSGRLDVGATVRVISYARHREAAPSSEAGCGVLDRDARVVVLTCQVDFGSSGAPVFLVVGGRLGLVSVISAMGEWRGRPAAFAVTVEDGLAMLEREFARPSSLATSHRSVRVGASRGGTIRFVRPGG